MKKSNATRMPMLGVAFVGLLAGAGAAHAADPSAGASTASSISNSSNSSSATQVAQAGGSISSAAPLTLSQASTVTAPLSPPPSLYTPPTSWNDTYIGYRVGTNFYYPGVRTASGAPAKITQNIGYLTTTGGFKYGSYAFNVDYLVSSMANPEAGPTNAYGYATAGSGGAQEVYSVGRVTFSASKIFGRPFSYGVMRDFGLTVGYEFGTKNDAYAERARMVVVGPTIDFAIPNGFWNVTLGVRTESNHDGITNVEVHFNPAVHLESSWLYAFRLGPVPLVFKGFASVTGPKGRDGFGVETTTEFLTRAYLLADVGSFVGHPRTAYMGLGYEYWHNMYGTRSSEQPGTTQTSVPMFVAEIHF
ncbi:hypothetical protein [Paraburkholderia tropica]|uniref:Outer membrane beta-barrel porin/alpha-amylase n=1 Tax=Paraburkholderia tropica TaxID=92647 RepID=A0ABX5MG24_9BURK|nr:MULTISPECIES: hypothetical protein [Paraburkholderia]MBB2983863.1 nucleoside-specific outer membrane channel protein Tsx [Paraburkholderia tropica]MDE1140405.1 hypothetical protein [Paraburkholderia tropica]PXX05950.1 hypothetical protein C7400_13855 [Paraburkholderia tropica]PZW71807.1 hypothetical protein C7399_13855 [Paraburkholderia tropica]